MKVIFAGPTLYGAKLSGDSNFKLLDPARQGDIFRAVSDGVHVIGLIDGFYEQVPAIWHKEILFALSKGVKVFGSSSMGALRAAECAAFGMMGVGVIFEDYRSGSLEDDSDVALLHAPKEMGYMPVTEALVNVRATLNFHLGTGSITDDEHRSLLAAATSLFFKERTLKTMLVHAGILPPGRSVEIYELLKKNWIDQKLEDAKALIEQVVLAEDCRVETPAGWTLARTQIWYDLFGREHV